MRCAIALALLCALSPLVQAQVNDETKLSRGLTVRAWYGPNEISSSRNAASGQLWYGGIDAVELKASGGWTDEITYATYKGAVDGYWHYAGDSFLRLSFALRDYSYSWPGMPAPDHNAYQLEPRAELEVSHWFSPLLRAGVTYQLSVPDFQYDTASWAVNNKLTGNLDLRLGGFTFSAVTAALRDPDPAGTVVANSPGVTAGTPTSVSYRLDFLLGGGASFDAGWLSVGALFLTNRDLDASFDWSLLSSIDVRPLPSLVVSMQWMFDHYAAAAGAPYAGNTASVLQAEARWDALRALTVGAGASWVVNPGPTSLTNSGSRNDVSLLLTLTWRTGLL